MTPKLINLRTNMYQLEHGTLTIWFSYETPIAFLTSQLFVARQNEWGPTTGKHLNVIGANSQGRIPGPEFEARLKQVWPTPSV